MTTPLVQQLGALEALLFVSGEALTRKKIISLLSLNENEYPSLIEALAKRYAGDTSSGLMIIQDKEHVELATKPEHSHVLESFTKSFLQESLSRAALEVLAIIAYRAPLSRSAIEAIRGVNCSFTLRNLLLRGLIEREENPEDTREYLYTPSLALLEKLGLPSKEALPDFVTLSQDERLTKVLETSPNDSVAPSA